MLFNSIEYFLFLPLFFALYWTLAKYSTIRTRNIFILAGSYVFYGWWDWKYLILIIISSFIDYSVGIGISRNESKKIKKRFLYLSLAANLGMLGYFKYSNFFIENFAELLQSIGFNPNISSLEIILPVGISFYTFQTLSYSIDIYRGKMKPTKDIVAFFTYVSFFPQLVAGPIERAINLLPQFYERTKFSFAEARMGMQQILWGLFKKIVIADNCAIIVKQIFENYETQGSLTLIYGSVLFAFQIYGDFSGYSDIAIGTSRLLNFKLHKNFAYPYFSRDIAEFWRRWHISLSTWFRDYLYIPMGGSHGSRRKVIFNVFVIFLVSGFWHGSKWNFIIWGGLNAIYFIPLLLRNKNRKNTNIIAENSYLPSFNELIQVLFTFGLTCFAWIFFRAETMTDAVGYIKSILYLKSGFYFHRIHLITIFFPIFLLIVVEWINRRKEFGLALESSSPKLFRWSLYSMFIILIAFIGSFEKAEFIYFQF